MHQKGPTGEGGQGLRRSVWIRRRAGTGGDVGETKAVKIVGGIRSRRSQIVSQNPARKEAHGGVAGGRSNGGGLGRGTREMSSCDGADGGEDPDRA